MEYIREEIEDLEEFVLTNPIKNMNEEIIHTRKKILGLKTHDIYDSWGS